MEGFREQMFQVLLMLGGITMVVLIVKLFVLPAIKEIRSNNKP